MNKINWLDHLTNLLVVILGISIAFYLEGYRESEASKNRERQYLESLTADLEADLEALDTLRQINELISKAVVSLSNASVDQRYEDQSTLRNDVLIIQYNPPFTPQRTIYESMKSAGQMNQITDFELRKSITELYEQYYRGTDQYDDALSEHVRDFIKPFCMEQVKFTSANSVDDAFLNHHVFRNMIFAYRYLFIAKDNFYKEVMKKAEEVKLKIENHLNEL
ncbi:MAG: hypothetical protein Tsb0034_19160 [Ekhidna sp.]